MTPEQQRALAIARARRRRAEADLSGLDTPAPSQPVYDKVRTASGGFLEGVPVVGPLLREGADRISAAALAATGPETYAEARDKLRADRERLKQENPITDTVSGIAGGVAGTVPLVMAAPAAFGVGPAGLGMRTAASIASGGVLGGADSAVRSRGDAVKTAWGAGAGALTGAFAPAAGDLIGAGIRGGRNYLARRAATRGTDLTARSLGQLDRAVAADDLTPRDVQARLVDMGPNGMVADLGPNLQRQAAALAATPGRGQEIVRKAIMDRDKAANLRIRSELDTTLGPAPVPSRITSGVEGNQAALSPEYTRVLEGASPVDAAPVARYLDREIKNLRGEAQSGLAKVRRMLNRAGTEELDTSPRVLLEVRKAVDGMLETTMESNARNALSTTRQAIDDLLTRAVPGIKDVDARHAELARQKEAFARGQQVLDSGRTAPRPEELAREVGEGVLPQGRMTGPSAVPMRMAQGARAEIDRIVGTTANDRVALQRAVKGEGDWNRSRLETLFGQDKANRVIGLADRERAFADTSNIVTRNSETAARQAAQREIGGAAGDAFGAREAFMAGGTRGVLRSLGVNTVERMAQAMRGAGREADNEALARALTTSDRDQVVRALMKMNGGRKPSRPEIDVVLRAIMLGGGPAAVGAATGR